MLKFLDLMDLFCLRTSAESDLKDATFGKNNFPYFITLDKNSHKWTFFLEDKDLFERTVEILRKYCFLFTFSENYEKLQVVGKGSFSTVFAVKNKMNNQLFAGKFFNKKSPNYETHKV